MVDTLLAAKQNSISVSSVAGSSLLSGTVLKIRVPNGYLFLFNLNFFWSLIFRGFGERVCNLAFWKSLQGTETGPEFQTTRREGEWLEFQTEWIRRSAWRFGRFVSNAYHKETFFDHLWVATFLPLILNGLLVFIFSSKACTYVAQPRGTVARFCFVISVQKENYKNRILHGLE